jgi:riboflavin kinase / FMN adenylyltransferase
MELIRGLHNIKPRHQECVVTIGNFDGLHRGHQTLLQRLITKSQFYRLPSMVILFEPQPNEYFSKHENLSRLLSFREKIVALQRFGIDRVLCIYFNEAIALQIAELFVRKILVEKLAAKYVLVGDDFRFGFKRMGDFALLSRLSDRYHFKAEQLDSYRLQGERVSSTRIKQLLQAGNMEQATELLGRPYSIPGKVTRGNELGRQLGFPTANINLHCQGVPIKGVFAVMVLGLDETPIAGVANIGLRPTLAGKDRIILEVHLLDFTRDIYGRNITILFLHKFRDEQKFNSLEELKDQIAKDVVAAKKFHATHDFHTGLGE